MPFIKEYILVDKDELGNLDESRDAEAVAQFLANLPRTVLVDAIMLLKERRIIG